MVESRTSCDGVLPGTLDTHIFGLTAPYQVKHNSERLPQVLGDLLHIELREIEGIEGRGDKVVVQKRLGRAEFVNLIRIKQGL